MIPITHFHEFFGAYWWWFIPTYLVIGLIFGREWQVHYMQDEDGKWRKSTGDYFVQYYDYGDTAKAVFAWPIYLLVGSMFSVAWAIHMTYKLVFQGFFRWWFVHPAIKKAQRHGLPLPVYETEEELNA